MSQDRFRSTKTQQRIAEALGTDAANFFTEHSEQQNLNEVAELLTAFDQIVDPNDRRACLDFVRSISERQRTA